MMGARHSTTQLQGVPPRDGTRRARRPSLVRVKAPNGFHGMRGGREKQNRTEQGRRTRAGRLAPIREQIDVTASHSQHAVALCTAIKCC
jgi:hypothetical protein